MDATVRQADVLGEPGG
uniref:Uncharacterized protein n=1 Tax=Arundo donax TaxID=35708 RepID=A0A0A8YM54_ARUDO